MRVQFFSRKIFTFLSALLLIVILSGCGSSQEFVSTWPGQAIQIDGNSQDWQGNLQVFPKENYSVGMKNDNKFLYLCFTTTDRNKIMNIMRSGMSVVFSSPDKAKDYTIRFPLVNPNTFRESVGALGQDAMQKEGISFLYQEMLDKQVQFYLIQNEFLNTVSMKNKENIEVKMGTTNDLLVYELKVPLAMTESSFPIGAMPGEKVNVTIETDPSRVAFREGQSAGQNAPGGQSGGGRSGGRGGRGAQPAAQPAGGDTGGNTGVSLTDKFSVEFSLQLAKEVK